MHFFTNISGFYVPQYEEYSPFKTLDAENSLFTTIHLKKFSVMVINYLSVAIIMQHMYFWPFFTSNMCKYGHSVQVKTIF